MHIDRLYTSPGAQLFPDAACRIHEDDNGAQYIVPRHWGGAAVETLISQIFYAGDIPAKVSAARDAAVPSFLWPSHAASIETKRENDIRDVLHRVAGSLAYHAARAGLFDGPADAENFYDELRYILFHQIATLEPALWSLGLDWAYGITAAAVLPQERIAALPLDFSARALPLSAVMVSKDEPRSDILKRIRLLAGIDALENKGAQKIAVMLPVEHADSPTFIAERKQEDIDTVARRLGVKLLKTAMHHVMDATDRAGVLGFDPSYNFGLKRALDEARAGGAPEGALQRAIELARQGHENVDLGTEEEDDIEPSAFVTPVVSLPDDFIETALTGHGFMMVDGGKAAYHAPAPELLATVSDAVWSSGAPEIFFRGAAQSASIFNEKTELGRGAGGGLIFLPDVEAPSATINLAALAGAAPQLLDLKKFEQTVTIITIALESSLFLPHLSARTKEYRPLCIGLAGLSSLLMAGAVAYDSSEGRATAALVTAALSGAAYLASARIADSIGAFDRYADVIQDYLPTIKARIAALGGTATMLPGLMRRPPTLNVAHCPDESLVTGVRQLWDKAYGLGKEQGFRHAHLTALATDIDSQGLLGTQTRDLWPENALVRFEGYYADNSGEGALYGKKLNPAVPRALSRLGYTAAQIDDIHAYAVGHGTLLDAPVINHARLSAKGFSNEALMRLDAALQNAQHLRYVFNEWTLGEGAESLEALGFTDDEIDDASLYACGAMSLEGAPHLKPNHLSIFDCQRAAVPDAVRAVSAEAQLKMQAAVEPFLSGGAGHVLALDHHTGIDDVQKLILMAWELGLKGVKLYREASSLQHPLAIEASADEPQDETKPLKMLVKNLK